MAAPATSPAPPPTRLSGRVTQPSWAGAIGLFVVTAGWVIGLRPFADNSFLTHLATGRIILDTGAVPSADPYTFTAHGEPWVVQSWLVSLAYAGAEMVGGLDAVRLLNGALVALLAGLGWALLRAADGLLVRLAVAGMFLVVGAELWAERPFIVGLICFSATVLAVEDRLDPRWLVPILWVWVNSHGSFPLGLVLIVVCALGTKLDGASPAVELRCLRWAVLGTLLGMVGPLGPTVLIFPIELLQRQDVLQSVIEWRAPTFISTGQRMFIAEMVLAIVLVARRPSYRSALVVAVFGATALLGARNLVVASIAFLPAMAPALSGVGALRGVDRPRLARMAGATAVVVLLLLTVIRLDQAPLNLRRYPTGPLAYLENHDVDTRDVKLAAPDFVGNLVDYVYGPDRRTFYDDRFDMFPEEVTAAHFALLSGAPSLRSHLDELDIDLVTVLSADAPAQILLTDPGWRPLYLDERWVLLCRRGADLGGTAGTC